MSERSSPPAGTAHLEVRFTRDRDRLRTLVQPVLALPQYLVLCIALLPLNLVVVYAWLALVITARWPAAPFRWLSGWLRAFARVWAYLNIVSAAYPPWTVDDDPEYEVRLLVGPPKQSYSRLKVFFRLIYVLPAWFAAAVGGMGLYALLIVSWLFILLTGHQEEKLFDLQRRALTWFTMYGLLVNLVIENYDWTLSGSAPSRPASAV